MAMARQITKIEIVKDADNTYPDFFEIIRLKRLKSLKYSKPSKPNRNRKSKKSLSSVVNVTDIQSLEPKYKRIFLYLKLENIVNLPLGNNQMKLLLKQLKKSISKLDGSYQETFIDLSAFETYKPTFSITIDQDSIEELNCFSDNPLHITLYDSKAPKKSVDRESVGEKCLEPDQDDDRVLAEGYIDLLQFFCSKRTGAYVETYLYPVEYNSISMLLATTRATWQVYTLLPLLKNISFCNLVYIGFESIYNATPEIAQDCNNLIANLWFRSKIPNENNEYTKEFLCSFSGFDNEIIAEQNINQKWETIKANNNNHSNHKNTLGIYTGCQINIYKLFNRLLSTEGVDFQMNHIDILAESALISNSLHRYILTEELSQILEDCVAFNQQEILVEIANVNTPDNVLLQGVIDLSIFLYPSINAMRFGVDLRAPQPIIPEAAPPKTPNFSAKSKTAKSKGSSAKSETKPISEDKFKPVKRPFAIISICLVNPITDPKEQLTIINENPMKSERLKNCAQINPNPIVRTVQEICDEEYQQFDDLIAILIDYIIQNNIKSTAEAKNFFCCHIRNVVNKVMRLISYDFNVRFSTKTNPQFANLMTTVYKELVQRIYDSVQNYNLDDYYDKREEKTDSTQKLLRIIAIIKHMFEVGNDEMGEFLLKKIKKDNPNNTTLNFCLYIYDVEKQRFESAQEYQRRPLKERVMNCDYFMHLIRVYINYMNDLENEEASSDALEHLLEALRDLTLLYPKETDGFILLYCLYKRCGYLPGISYARWKFDNLLQEENTAQLITLPISLWQIYNSCKLEFTSERNRNIYNVMRIFLILGLYKFAEFVYAEISAENTEAERYLVSSTLKVLLKEVDKKYAVRTFPTDKLLRGQEIKAFNAQINGNLEYYRENIDGALKNYARILDINDLEKIKNYRLAFMRYGFHMIGKQEYEKAIKAFEKCCTDGISCMVPQYEMGKAYYRLHRLEDALECFAKATNYALHVPDIWGYLALVNLRLGENFKALECWKYAKLKPETIISEEVLNELTKIDYRDIFLYVDLPA